MVCLKNIKNILYRIVLKIHMHIISNECGKFEEEINNASSLNQKSNTSLSISIFNEVKT